MFPDQFAENVGRLVGWWVVGALTLTAFVRAGRWLHRRYYDWLWRSYQRRSQAG